MVTENLRTGSQPLADTWVPIRFQMCLLNEEERKEEGRDGGERSDADTTL